MRFFLSFLLIALAWVLASDNTQVFAPVIPRETKALPIVNAKVVCGDFGQGYTCRNEPGALRRGKMRKIPGSSSGQSSGGLTEDGDPDALPPAPGDTGTNTQAPGAAPATCPVNAELLGGHCIPYTQTCRKGLAANAPPQVCRSAEEKLVCDFRADGLKDCCCRTYSKF